ncbi:MAG: ribosomal RNA small subunit methyltransferase A [Chlamydiia bacterium]|nr:ribosomal RNA small subunit methyltransferase A [Chlamydiia bacterium]MCP5509322.1 ribosomal RNA small subunit methyltransferase A [Chlamydiales bacterium]HPE85282.1 16S rRNA (adenine(1518)-N(6)/adenine(1519)-N(6))-dimethyltransferase RsmA [Chlamydiales bacterium]
MKPKKALSQNFLVDDAVVNAFVDAACVAAGETIVEIGPGYGAITKALLKKGAHVLGIEIDPHLAKKLKAPNLEIVEGDALTFDYTRHPTNKVVANLPFQIATPLIIKLIQLPFNSITIMIQKEVGESLIAQPSTSAYSPITLQTQNLCAARYLFTVPSSAFHPQPKIEAAAIQLIPHPPLYSLDMQFVACAFRQRRKMLKSALKDTYPEIKNVMQDLNLDLTARAENLTLEEFAKLYNKLFA